MTSEDVGARRLHRGLRRAFGETLREVEGAWIEERAGYGLSVYLLRIGGRAVSTANRVARRRDGWHLQRRHAPG